MHRASRVALGRAKLAAFLQTHLQASLPMGFQKLRSIRLANDPALALGGGTAVAGNE